MKKFRLALYALATAFATSCSAPKQVFYFPQDSPAPKVTSNQTQEPTYSASNAPVITDLPRTSLTITPENNSRSTAATTFTKKELRKLLRKTLKDIKDSTDTRGRNNRVGISANKNRLSQLEAEARDLKNSVRVQNDDKKVMVDVKKPVTDFSQTELILLGVAALLILLILLSLPVLGTILGVVLALAVIALAVGLLTGYIEFNA
jgi:hypothetical protein